MASKVVGYLVKKEMIEDEKEYKDFYQYASSKNQGDVWKLFCIRMVFPSAEGPEEPL